MIESKLERSFWRCWLSGLLLLATMIAMNAWISSDISPYGIGDHQTAGTAERINSIQTAWRDAGVLGLARLSMAIDLVFIAVYSFGAYCGGRLFAQTGKPTLRRLGRVIAVAAILFGLTDYIETICQVIQIIRFEGDDMLAGIAATVQPAKSVVFLISFLGILVALLIRRMTRRAA